MVLVAGFISLLRTRFCERGVSVLELSIATPLILLVIAGAVDVGTALRREQVIYAAAKQAARIGGTQRKNPEKLQFVSCRSAGPEGPLAPSALPACDALPAGEVPVDVAAKRVACNYLKEAGLDPEAWTVLPQVREVNSPLLYSQASKSFGPTMQLVSVEIKSKTKPCFLCLIGPNEIRATSSFALEERCSNV